MKIAICGEIFSSNLGDGVIAHSLAWLLKHTHTKTDICFVDFSARSGFQLESLESDTINTLFKLLHSRLTKFSYYRKVIVPLSWHLLKRNKFSSKWESQISNCDLILIGGGQLLMDNDLVFPLKINELVKISKAFGKNIIFYGCGVGNQWSCYGHHLLQKFLQVKNVKGIFLRDKKSIETLKALLPERSIPFRLTADPAIFSREAFVISRTLDSSTIGLGIAAPKVLKTRCLKSQKFFETKFIKSFWMQLATLLHEQGIKFVFFTNGSTEDYEFAKTIVSELASSNRNIPSHLLPRALEPITLVRQIAGFRVVIAHRLHANIIAYSLGIPSIGLSWDDKVMEFGKMTNRQEFFLEPSKLNAEIVYSAISEAISSPMNSSRLNNLKALSFKNIGNVLSGF